MITVFLSHSSKDKPFVRQLADFPESDDIHVWLDEREIAPGQNIVGSIEEALNSDFILLILSPDSVGSNWVKEEWTDAFWEQINDRKTKLAGVLYRDCRIPNLLRNKKYFDLRTNQPEGFRQIRTFLLTQKPPPPPRVSLLPARPPIFIGREDELLTLRARLGLPGSLVHIAGRPGQGKTRLALEFGYRYGHDFESVYWLPCQSLSLPSISSELQRLLGLKLEGDLDANLRELKDTCARKRCLLILDNVADEEPGKLIPGGAASVLITTRLKALRFLRSHKPLDLSLFTEGQCFELFEEVLGTPEVERHNAECKVLFERLGYLSIAVAVSAGLIQQDVRYTIARLASNLPADVTALINEAIEALDTNSRTLLAAMASCAPEGFRLEIAAAIASFDEETSLGALQQLVSRSLADEVDRTERRYRLHALVREAANGAIFGRQHAEAVCERFENWETNWRQCQEDLPDFRVAFDWALAKTRDLGPSSLSGRLAYLGYLLTHRIGRLAESLDICGRMSRVSEERKDIGTSQVWLGNQALILIDWGRLEEALALLREQEAMCLELRDKDGLLRSYGHQGLIVKASGRLEEALALHKKEEEICLELGDKNSLQISYGNQGLILQDWGRTEEALALHKKQEAICLELGNKYGLQISYGNQAGILYTWRRPGEALALLKEQETICVELGNKSGLGYCYVNWGRLARLLGETDEEQQKLNAALAIFAELKMPVERDAVAAELAKTKAASTNS